MPVGTWFELKPEGTERTGSLPNILNGWDMHHAKSAHSCSFQGSVTYLPLEEVKECICKNEIDYYAWHDLCRSNNNSITQSSSKPVPESMTFLQIKMDYYECITDEQYGTQCQDSLKENMDEYCRMTTESHSEYDECFGQITDIQ